MDCHELYTLDDILKMDSTPICPRCGGLIKPDVVLYEEGLDQDVLYNAVEAISRADLIIVAGTSLSVYPAAGLIRYFNGKYIVVINKEHLNVGGVTLDIDRPVGEVFKDLN